MVPAAFPVPPQPLAPQPFYPPQYQPFAQQKPPDPPPPPQAQAQDESNSGQEPSQQHEPDMRHLQYALEIQIFAFVGWGWLSAREYLGRTPVMDVATIGMVLLTSIANTIAALVCGDAEPFEPFAKAFLGNSVALALLYGYSLSESLAQGGLSIGCQGGITGGLSSTYKEAYFGGLTLHQAFASATLAFLIVVVILSVAQARACNPSSSSWLLRGTNQTFLILMALHLVFFALRAPLNVSGFGRALIIVVLVLAGLTLIVMVDIEWLISVIVPQTTEHSRRDDRIWQEALELISLTLLGVAINLLSFSLSSGLSMPAVVFTGLSVVLSAVAFVNEVFVKPYYRKHSAPPGPAAALAAALGQRRGVKAAGSHARDGLNNLNYQGFFSKLRQTTRRKNKGM